MTKIARYVTFELLKSFVVALTAMTCLSVLIFLGQEGMRQGLGPQAILRLVPYVLPNALSFAIPGTILFSTCVVYGRLSSTNEIVAIKSMGVSVWVVILPAIILSLFLSGITLFLNDVAVSWGRQGIYQVVLESVEQTVFSRLKSHKSFNNAKMAIDVVDVVDSKMISPHIVIYGNNGDNPRTVTADEAWMKCDTGEGTLTISLRNGEIDDNRQNILEFDRIDEKISLGNMTRKSRNMQSPSNLALRDIAPEITRQTERIEEIKKELAVNASMSFLMGDFGHVANPQLEQTYVELENAEIRKCRLKTEPWRRWATGFSCLFFVIVGVPLSIALKNSDVWTSFGICFIPILVLYFPLVMLGVDRAKTGAWPPYSVWIGNVVLLVVGLYMLRKVLRH